MEPDHTDKKGQGLVQEHRGGLQSPWCGWWVWGALLPFSIIALPWAGTSPQRAMQRLICRGQQATDQAPPPSQASVSPLSAMGFVGVGESRSIQGEKPSCRPSLWQAPGQEELGGAGKSGGRGPGRRRRGRRRPQERPQMLPAFLEGSARPAPPDVPHKQLPCANKVSAWLQLAAHRRRLNAWHCAGEGAWSGRGLGEGQGAAHAQHRTPWPWPWLLWDHAPSSSKTTPFAIRRAGWADEDCFIGCFLAWGRWGCHCSSSRASCEQKPHPVPTSPCKSPSRGVW